MTYDDAIEYLYNIEGLGAKLGLDRVRILAERLGSPHKKLKIIHIAGTNGKGSSCAMISNILMDAGFKVGMYTSPHLEDYNERYKINDIKISNKEFANIMEKVKSVCDAMKDGEYGQPTVFEVLTAMAFEYFYEQQVDYAVIEVGLGGRFDATNIIKEPILSVIASISMDHMDFLGNTLEQIAMEKGGIVKENCPVVLYSQTNEVFKVIEDICLKRNAPLCYAKSQKIDILERKLTGTTISVTNEYFDFPKVKLGLIGDYQAKNCALAILAAKTLQSLGIEISDNNILKGIEKTKWVGRMEICAFDPIVLIDGAHNADGIDMLASSLKKYFSDKDITLLMGVLGDKEYDKMAEELVPIAKRVVVTKPLSQRALDVDRFRDVVEKYNSNVDAFDNINEAYKFALSETKKDDVLVCAGSLYLIGELRKIIYGRNYL